MGEENCKKELYNNKKTCRNRTKYIMILSFTVKKQKKAQKPCYYLVLELLFCAMNLCRLFVLCAFYYISHPFLIYDFIICPKSKQSVKIIC